MDKLIKLMETILSKQSFRFLISGGTAAGVDVVSYYVIFNYILLKQDISFFHSIVSAPVASLICSFSLGFVTSFALSKYFVFTESNLRGRQQLVRFIVVGAINFACNYFLMKFFVEFLHFFPTVARVISIGIVAFLSFYLHKVFTFKVKVA